ncbi:T9SS type A sorting domain-containing protein [bacterium]|nr:T9SS type A sorting domain-containing protein [bacterium]
MSARNVSVHGCLVLFNLFMQTLTPVFAADSGGVLMPEQAAYDVTYYDLDLTVDVNSRTIDGSLTVSADILDDVSVFVLDLASEFEVSRINEIHPDASESGLSFERPGGQIRISRNGGFNAGESVRIRIEYGGRPHEAEMPPWEGGFVWEVTPLGQPWAGVACEGEGADIWWPCKDHPSDEPDSMAMHFTVPDDLICASNGRLRSVENHGNGFRTFHWFSSTPINTYNVTLNLAPYNVSEDRFVCISGDTLPLFLYFLPGDISHTDDFLGQMKTNLEFLESVYGPYPFRIDKYGVARTPYLGMEHQTIISYGDEFVLNAYGFDTILFHETVHEWWGNLITNSDWKDLWLHEGFATYTEALFAEHLLGETGLHGYIEHNFNRIQNRIPLVPAEPASFDAIYGLDVYYKAARVIHSLRYLLGDAVFFPLLRQMLYPSPASEQIKTGEQCRSVNTEDFISLAETVSGRSLGWFFDAYLRVPALPVLETSLTGDTLLLQWITESPGTFRMMLDIKTGETVQRVDMESGNARIRVGGGPFEIDPLNWVLKEVRESTKLQLQVPDPESMVLYPAFPNPFNGKTVICFDLQERQHVQIRIFNSRGECVSDDPDRILEKGSHRWEWHAENFAAGIYILRINTPHITKSQKLVYTK